MGPFFILLLGSSPAYQNSEQAILTLLLPISNRSLVTKDYAKVFLPLYRDSPKPVHYQVYP